MATKELMILSNWILAHQTGFVITSIVLLIITLLCVVAVYKGWFLYPIGGYLCIGMYITGFLGTVIGMWALIPYVAPYITPYLY